MSIQTPLFISSSTTNRNAHRPACPSSSQTALEGGFAIQRDNLFINSEEPDVSRPGNLTSVPYKYTYVQRGALPSLRHIMDRLRLTRSVCLHTCSLQPVKDVAAFVKATTGPKQGVSRSVP